MKDNPIAVNHLKIDSKRSAAAYEFYHNLKLPPQACREVLPGNFYTSIVMGGYVSDWLEVFRKRINHAVHPDTSLIMQMVQKDMFTKSILTDYANSLDIK
jgi:hypothetical protein